MKSVPITLDEAKKFVGQEHRHHKPPVGHRWSIGAEVSGELVGVLVVSRPVARNTPQYVVAEITRLATNGYANACSFLYAKATRIAREMGYHKIQTFILKSEPGASLKALKDLGWVCEGESAGGDWNTPSRGNRRTDQPQEPKMRWSCTFKAVVAQ